MIAASPTAGYWSNRVRAVLAGELDDALTTLIEACNLAAEVDDRFPLNAWQGVGAMLGADLDIAIYWRGEQPPEELRVLALLLAMTADFAAGLARVASQAPSDADDQRG